MKVEEPINPFDACSKAELNYAKQFSELMAEWHNLYEHIKPLIENDKDYSELARSIHTKLVALLVARITITLMHAIVAKTSSDILNLSMPPLKLECPKCNTLVWDMSAFKEFIQGENGTKNMQDK